jgi:hypothetical protein
MVESCPRGCCTMGVDTGRNLHVVVLREETGRGTATKHVIHLAVCHEFSELDALMERFGVHSCVIDGLPETHATREFAGRHPGRVFMNFFNEHQRGGANWNREGMTVQINRTEALDASRTAIREGRVGLPRRAPIVEEFAKHMTGDAKVLDEDEETGIKKYRYVRLSENHFSMAFTYAWFAGTGAKIEGGLRSRR